MKTVDIRIAKKQFSKLIAEAVKGESYVVTRAGKPLARVLPVRSATARRVRRLGFLVGQIAVPTDFDQMKRRAIQRIFTGGG